MKKPTYLAADNATDYVGEPKGKYAMLDLAGAPMVLTESGSHIIRYVNPAFCALVGKERDELIGNAFVEMLQEAPACRSFLDQVLRAGQTVGPTMQDFSECHLAKWSYEVWPVLAADDHPAGLMMRITERSGLNQKMAEANQALLVSAIRQHELTDAAETLNDKLKAEIKKRRQTAHTAETLNDKLEAEIKERRQAAHTAETLNTKLETEIKERRQAAHIAETLNTKLEAEIKERLQAEEALIKVEKLAAVGRMAASMAHEINNPLEAVMNSIFLAQNVQGLPDAARAYLQTADEELRRVSHLTRQTLGFYRESTVPVTISVSALLDSVVNLLQSKIRATEAQVETRCDTGLQVRGIFGELRQVLSNLLANSLDAVEKNGTIRLHASLAPCGEDGRHCVRITVADTGKGIDPVTMKQIFDPFFTTKGAVGTGLGLWVSKQIIDKHDGSIHVRSSTTGAHHGTTFSVILPRTEAAS